MSCFSAETLVTLWKERTSQSLSGRPRGAEDQLGSKLRLGHAGSLCLHSRAVTSLATLLHAITARTEETRLAFLLFSRLHILSHGQKNEAELALKNTLFFFINQHVRDPSGNPKRTESANESKRIT